MTDIRGLLTEEDAVSPVIGVVLMVAVTVILSAAVGAFVLDIGNAVTEQRPNVVVEFEFDLRNGSTDSMTLRHTGGDRLATENVRVAIDGRLAWESGSNTSDFNQPASEWGDGITSGDELVLVEDGEYIDGSSVAQVVWQKNGHSSILASSDD